MNAEIFAEFLEKLGHKVIKTKSAYWYNVEPFSYLSFPFHYNIKPSPDELSTFWYKFKVIVVRYPTDLDCKGRLSYRIICKNKDYNLHSLTSKARNQTRRGLENCEVRQIDFKFLTKEGLEIYVDTLIRQGRKIPKDLEKKWNKYCNLASQTPGFEAWGAFIKNKLVAYIIGFIMDDCYNIFIQRSRHEFLKYYPNNALVYQMTKNVLTRSYIDIVSYGLESVQEELESLVHFKIGMGFVKEPIKQRIIFHPFLRPLINFGSLFFYKFADKYTNKELCRKLKGIINFAMDSK